ncbi:small ribosomal subunit protein uS2-like [Balaenoptera ricei]|uniref:small ribosomal subunit protein uS2-like n=1 Tax=Balaenoptera ricei TaxID=2746895 RepID=UPI0028BE2132|nr:small ribosomal subunit protein uS2-like [Balaenoptera ricei]
MYRTETERLDPPFCRLSGEPLVTWVVRVYDAGAAGILIDDGDAHKFGTINAHSIPNSMERWYNSIADKQTRIQMVEVNPNSNELKDSSNFMKFTLVTLAENPKKGAHSVGLMWWMLAREVLRMRGTISPEHPWEVMPDLYFYRDPEEIEKEEQAAAEKAVTKEEFQGEWTAPAPEFTAAQPEVADWSEGVQVPSVPIQQFPTEDWSAQPATEDWSAAPTAQATEWVGTTTEWS